MDNKMIIEEKLIINLLNNVKNQVYGSVGVSFDCLKTKLIALEAISAFNHIAGLDVFSLIENRLENDPNDYLLAYSQKEAAGAILSEGDYMYKSYVINVVNYENEVSFDMHIKTSPVAERYVKKSGLSLDYDVATGIAVLRKKVSGSIYARVKKTALDGFDFFVCNKTSLNIKTARVYCSNMKQETHFRPAAVASGDEIYIYFRPLTEVEEKTHAIKENFVELSRIAFYEDLQAVKDFINQYAHGPIQPQEAPVVTNGTFDDDADSERPDTTAGSASGDEVAIADPEWREVDGLKQYVIPIPEAETEPGLPEDEDF